MVEWWVIFWCQNSFSQQAVGGQVLQRAKCALIPNWRTSWSILTASARRWFLQRTRQLSISNVTSLSLPPNFRLPLDLTAAHLQTLASSGALRVEDAVSLSLPYSAEMLWQSISQGDAVSMATPHCKISKLDYSFSWEVQEQGRNEAICQQARLEKRKPCSLIL